MKNSVNTVNISTAVLSLLLSVSLLSSCGGGGGTLSPDPNIGQNPGTPAVGKADLSGQLLQAGGSRVSSAAGDGLSGLLVSLINTASGQQSAAQRTSAAGKFEFKGMPSGSQYLMKVEFTSSSDLDGDGRLDEIELYQPLSMGSQAVVELLSKIGVADSDGDGQLDAIEVETQLSDDRGLNNTLRSQHRRRSGETRRDDDGNGSFDDNPGVRDSDGDGIPDVPMSGGTIGGGSGLFELEVKGSIEAISGSSITVSGQSFALSSATTWRIDDNRNADPAQFTVGTFVEVEGIRDGSGGWIATKVKTEDDFSGGTGGGGTVGIEREVKGFIEAISAGSITVGGVTFSLTPSTTWRIDDNRSASPGQFSVGMFVEVEGPADGQGGYTATKVKTEDDFGPSGGDDDDSNDDNGGNSGSDDDDDDDSGSDDDEDDDDDDDNSGSDDDDDDDDSSDDD